MSVITVSTPPVELEVLAISDREWRIRDNALPPTDATSLLGFVAQIGSAFEVMRLGAPLSRWYFSSLDDAVEFVARSIQHA